MNANPTCRFRIEPETTVSRLVDGKLRSQEPFSLIRIGDGEGVLLSISRDSPQGDAAYLHAHFGPASGHYETLATLRGRLETAISGADVVGVRDDIVNVEFATEMLHLPAPAFLDQFRQAFHLRETERNLEYPAARRIALVHSALGRYQLSQATIFCSAWYHYQIQNSGEIIRMLSRQKRIGLVTCHSKLRGLIESLFELTVCHYQVPPMYRDLPADAPPPSYLDSFSMLESQIRVEAPGMLFIVGAGIFGKMYCQTIKALGGCALDLGSLPDAWLGLATRPTVYTEIYPSSCTTETGVPRELILNQEMVDRCIRDHLDE